MKNSLFFRILFMSILSCTSVQFVWSQTYFKQYPHSDNTTSNRGECIIRLSQDNFLSVGESRNAIQNGQALWTGANGILTGTVDYNAPAGNGLYSLKFILPQAVYGEYSPILNYTGHPATGWRYFQNPPDNRYFQTWTTIIDPLTGNRRWDYLIDHDSTLSSLGKSIVVDDESANTFYVLSQVYQTVNGLFVPSFAVTKYTWAAPMIGHQPVWSKRYQLDGYTFDAVGIVKEPGGNLIVAGNLKNSVHTRIGITEINPVNGAAFLTKMIEPRVIVRNDTLIDNQLQYRVDTIIPRMDFIVNSISGRFQGSGFILSGKIISDTLYDIKETIGYIDTIPNPPAPVFNTYTKYRLEQGTFPMLCSFTTLPVTKLSGMSVYYYQAGGNDTVLLEGEFNHAIEHRQFASPTDFATVDRCIATGSLGRKNEYPYPSKPILQNSVLIANGGGPIWSNLYDAGGDYISEGTWITDNPGINRGGVLDTRVGEYVFTGELGSPQGDPLYPSTIQSATDKLSGYAPCTEQPYIWQIYLPDCPASQLLISASDWAIHRPHQTQENEPELDELSCSSLSRSGIKGRGVSQKIEEGIHSSVQLHSDGYTLQIKVNNPNASMLHVMISDILGNIVDQKTISITEAQQQDYSILLEALVQGAYIAKVDIGNARQSLPFVIVR
jgi:hypothetical protein